MMKKLISAVVCLVMMLGAAQAEFSQTYDQIMASDAVQAEITAQFQAYPAKSAMDTINQMLAPLTLRLTAGKEDGVIELVRDGQTVFRAPENASDAHDNLALLRDLYLDDVPILMDLVAGAGKTTTVKKSTSIKNVGASPKHTQITLTKDEANALYPQLYELMLPKAEKITANFPFADAFLTSLEHLSFTGTTTIKRYLDKNGDPMGLQITSKISDGEEKRSLTIYGGYNESKGIYLSFSSPAVNGNNNFKAVVSIASASTAAQNTATANITVTWRKGKEKYSLEDTVSLKNKKADEAITGTITRSETVDGVKTTWTLTPKLTGENGALGGTIRAVKKVSSKVSTDVLLNVTLSPASEFDRTPAGSLSQLIAEFMDTMDEKDRNILLTSFSFDSWMYGESVPVPDSLPAPDSAWAVQEE